MAPITVHIKCANEGKFSVQVDDAGTVLDLKRAIEENNGVAVSDQRLIFAGRVLADDGSIASYSTCSPGRVRNMPGSKPRLALRLRL